MSCIVKYVTPVDWWSYITTIPNDGNDYDVVFMGDDTYVIPGAAASASDIEVNHSAGGSITLRAQIPGTVNIRVGTPSPFLSDLGFIVDKFRMNGLTFNSDGYVKTDGANSFFTLQVGGRTKNIAYTLDPTTIELTQVKFFGSRVKMVMNVSPNELFYTNIHIEDCEFDESGSNMSLRIASADTSISWGYFHLQCRRIRHHGINGPDEISRWPTGANPASFSSHSDGTGWLEVNGMDGCSSVFVSEVESLSELRGSFNHDMHSIRLNNINSTDVSIKFADSRLKGYWSEGHVTSAGVGGKFTHLFYYHFNNIPVWPVGARPVLEFENVTFESRIGAAVSTDEFSIDPEQPPRELFWPNESADYHFYDCTFRWIVESALYDNPTLTAIGQKSDEITVVAHNSLFDIGENGVSWRPEGRPNATFTEDAETRTVRDEKWLRVHTLGRVQRENILGQPSFESQVTSV